MGAASSRAPCESRQRRPKNIQTAGRSAVIETFGVRVQHFANAEVCDDLDSVLARIRAQLRLPFD
jgi:very-short-patch-repair endonuclease